MQVAILWYSGRPHFLFEKLETFLQLIGNETSDLYQTSNGYVPHFWISWSSTFGKYSIFHPWQRFSANNVTSKYALLFIFSRPERLYIPWCVCQFYLSWSLVRPFLSNVSMFIIILIIRIIKTTRFNNTILMTKLERKIR